MIAVRDEAGPIAGSRILFAHQSVGANILDGLNDLSRDGVAVPVTTLDVHPRSWTGIASARLGSNGDPRSKTQAFVDAVSRSAPDVAVHKYCYVDMYRASDAGDLFAFYRDAMVSLAAAHPATTFVHMTMPLMSIESGPKATLKRFLNRPLDHVEANAARERFNDLIRGAFPAHTVFDLAALESATGQPRALRSDYTSDGGHLNERGRRHVAAAFVTFLAGIAAARPVSASL